MSPLDTAIWPRLQAAAGDTMAARSPAAGARPRRTGTRRLRKLGAHLLHPSPRGAAGSSRLNANNSRARQVGVPFEGVPAAEHNAITDVPGVLVGHTTLHHGDGDGAVRTGVTAVLPRGVADSACFAGIFSLNGAGEMTGSQWVDESGILYGPIAITNTHSAGVVRDAVIRWQKRFHANESWFGLPVVAETYDGFLSDIDGHHVTEAHAFNALDSAAGGPVAEGCVGGGTGMLTARFKGGIGTASRAAEAGNSRFKVGVLVQSNYGGRGELRIAGCPVGAEMAHECLPTDAPVPKEGSIIVVVATDAPLLPHQLQRLAKRAGMGLARMGSYAGNSSGDIFIAFSTANSQVGRLSDLAGLSVLPTDHRLSHYGRTSNCMMIGVLIPLSTDIYAIYAISLKISLA